LEEKHKMSKRAFQLGSLIGIAAILLSACGGAAAPTAAPAAEPTAAPVEATTAPEPTAAPEATAETAAEPTAAPEAPAAAGEIKIAILAPLSGPVPTFGVSTRDGALMAIEEWNAKGGVNGMMIVPIVEDSQCTPDPSVNAANKVIDQDGVKFIIGEVCSKASIPISEIANAKKVIQVSPTSTNESVTVGTDGVVKQYIYRACFIDPFQGKVGAKFALETLNAKTAFIMLDQANDYVKGLAENFEKSFVEGGGTIVGKETYTAQDTDFSTILSKVAEAKPDMVYLPDYYNIVNLATKQAKEKGITVPFMGGDGWDSSDLDLASSDGGYFTNHYSPEDTRAEVVNFVKAYGVKYTDDAGAAKVPDALAALAYDATNMLVEAIQAAGTDDTEKVSAALKAIEFNGVSGKITFDENHNPVKSATILAVKEGRVQFNSVVNP
jgi:branched-chain amino acid transport system substrate-binding protein